MTDAGESPNWPGRLLAEHKIESAQRPEGGWDWSCSCGEKGVSADRRDHWADVIIQGIHDSEIRRYGTAQPRAPEHERELREVIFYEIDEEARRSKQ